MAKCEFCKQEMSDPNTTTCLPSSITFDGEELETVRYRPLYHGERCPDCNIAEYGFHHHGCDMERCPKCSGQLISCGCLNEET